MPIISRRVSLLMLSFAFFLLLAPALFSPPAVAQESGGISINSILPAAVQGGIGVIMLVVYLVQSDKEKKRGAETFSLITSQLTMQNETTKLAFEKYNDRTDQLLQLLKTSHEQNLQTQKDAQETTSLLTGTLARLQEKLSQPVVCPLKEFSQINSKGAQG